MIQFTKMQGTGNDFILINNMENVISYDYKKLSEYLCNRNFGVGADGVIYVEKSNIADSKMRIFNKDGSEAEMCGNGIRCFAKYLYDTNQIHKTSLKIETLAGIKDVRIKLEQKRVSSVIVDMGVPEFEYSKIPVYCRNKNEENYLEIENLKVYPVSIGNPHAVCFCSDIEKLHVEEYGSLIENYKYFPNKTNVEFVEVLDKNNIKLRVWERGVGETLACGTGACAAAVEAIIKCDINKKVIVHLNGGKLIVCYDENTNKVTLEGDSNKIYDGRIDI